MAVVRRNSRQSEVSWTPMLPRLVPVLFASAFATVSLASQAAAQTWESLPVNPQVEIAYIPPKSARLQPIYEAMKERRTLEELQHFLAPLRLPHPLQLNTHECDTVNMFYAPGPSEWSPKSRSINICYEWPQTLVDIAPKTVSPDGFVTRHEAIVGGLIGTILHEGGHMLFDMLTVPVFGREEDAADDNAAFLALQFNKDVARLIINGVGYQWTKIGKDPGALTPMRAWADEHGTASQRMYNTLCLGYGGDPQEFQEFVNRGWLPKKRAEHCGEEYAQLRLAFQKTVLPFIDHDLMIRVRQTQWFTQEELK